MDSIAERDPLFARYRAAWAAYQAAQLADPAESTPYTHALARSADGPLRSAAIELASARADWLAEV